MAKGKAVNAWHIFHYDELFRAEGANHTELEFVRYSKRHLTGWTAEAEQYCQQMAALKQTLAFEAFVMARHIFEELLDFSQMHHQKNKYLRGFVLDERHRPAGPLRIAQMIGCTAETATEMLTILERVGLIERAAVPPAPPKNTVKKTAEKPAEKATKKTAKKASGGSKSRKKAEGAHQVPPPALSFFKEEEKVEVPQPSASVKEQEENEGQNLKPAAAAAPPLGGQGTADAVLERPKGQGEPEPEEQAGRPGKRPRQGTGGSAGKAESPSSPTAAPLNLNLMDLTETDGGGPDSKTANSDSPSTIRLTDRMDELYDSTGYVFAERVYREIGVPHAMDSPTGRSEIEAFAAAWQRAMRKGLKPSELNALFDKMIKRAGCLGRQRRRGKKFRNSAEATLMYEFNMRLAGSNPFAKGVKKSMQK